MKQISALVIAPLLLLFFIPACTSQKKSVIDFKTSGFLDENCYQAILEFEPDANVPGLVAKRENSFIKSKNSDLKTLALDSLAYYCIESRLKPRVPANRKNADIEAFKKDLLVKLKNIADNGSIAFTYYSERNSTIIGYRLFKLGLREKVSGIINSMELTPGIHSNNWK